MRQLHDNKPFIWTLLAVFLLVWFYMLGSRVLVPTDEARYAEMAREIVATGDWVTPRLNGIKYFEKPPLQNWVTAATYEVFGLGDWQARLWTGLNGLLGIFIAAYAALRVYNARTAFYTALVLGGGFYWSGMGHVNSLDMGLSGMMALTLCSLLLGQRDGATRSEQRNWMLLCWVSMALAVLSKGLIGVVLPGAVLVLYTLVSRDWAIWKRLHLVKGLIAFFVVVAPWFILVMQRNPEFFQFFFIHEHFQRFTTDVHSRSGPWYYFFPILILGICPWLGVLFQSLVKGARKENEIRGPFRPGLMLFIWAVFIFIFFSKSHSKLPSYLLPIFPALAIMIGSYLDKASYKAIFAAALVTGIPALIGLGFVHLAPGIAYDPYAVPLIEAHVPWIYTSLLLFISGAVIALLTAKKRPELAIAALAFTGFLATQAVIHGHDAQGRHIAGYEHLAAMRAEIKPDTRLYMVDQYEHAFPFYLERTFTLVAYADEMAFGVGQEPHLWIPSMETFKQVWKTNDATGIKSLAIIRPSVYATLQAEGLPMRVIGQDPRRVIVVTPDTK